MQELATTPDARISQYSFDKISQFGVQYIHANQQEKVKNIWQ